MLFASPLSLHCSLSLGGILMPGSMLYLSYMFLWVQNTREFCSFVLIRSLSFSRYTGPRTMDLLQIVGTRGIVPTLDPESSPPIYVS